MVEVRRMGPQIRFVDKSQCERPSRISDFVPGGIVSVKVMDRTIIIVNSIDIMQELDKKGALYSDRPRLEMGGELLGYSETLVLIPYGDRFRLYRKNIAKYIGGAAQMRELHPLIETSTRKFLQRTMAKPDDLMAHLRK
jgi:hypothetical protein